MPNKAPVWASADTPEVLVDEHSLTQTQAGTSLGASVLPQRFSGTSEAPLPTRLVTTNTQVVVAQHDETPRESTTVTVRA